MAIKIYRPTSPGRRSMTGYSFEEITKSEPEKSLTLSKKNTGGRNFRGTISVRHHGGGSKHKIRVIDFKRDKIGIPGRVAAIEYDPNRSARIALIFYVDGEKRYILAPVGLAVDQVIKAGEDADIKPGNALPLRAIPSGTQIHNIELERGHGGQIVRSAGGSAQLMAKEAAFSLVRLPSGEMRKIHSECYATIGQVGNVEHQNISLGKAGRKRWMGWRPDVRGKVMTPRNHPHAGGEGKSPIGLPGPKSPWGQPTRGYKTRRRKISDKMIVKRRGSK